MYDQVPRPVKLSAGDQEEELEGSWFKITKTHGEDDSRPRIASWTLKGVEQPAANDNTATIIINIALYPTEEQKEILRRFAGCARFVYNLFLNLADERTPTFRNAEDKENFAKAKGTFEQHAKGGRWAAQGAFNRSLTKIKEVYTFLCEYPVAVLRGALKDLANAHAALAVRRAAGLKGGSFVFCLFVCFCFFVCLFVPDQQSHLSFFLSFSLCLRRAALSLCQARGAGPRGG
jgi:hypothetical protein